MIKHEQKSQGPGKQVEQEAFEQAALTTYPWGLQNESHKMEWVQTFFQVFFLRHVFTLTQYHLEFRQIYLTHRHVDGYASVQCSLPLLNKNVQEN